MILSEQQKAIIECNDPKIIVAAAAGSGKALENGSLVYTENGPIKIEDCVVGQKIYGEDGKLHNILGVYPQGKKRKFIVQFTDKTEISCCEEHLWTFQTSGLRSKKSKKWITASLKDIIAEYPIFINTSPSKKMNSTRRRNLFIPMTQPVEFPHQNVPLDPYTLGALLGDGHLNGTRRSSQFSSKDDDILERVTKGLEKIQCSLKKKSEDRFDYTIIQQGRSNIKGTFTKILEELKLDFTRSSTKFIPNIYKYNSTNIRLEVLRGLIDTDGHCDGSSYDIVLKSLRLILDIKEIVESLGLTATFQEKKAVCTNSINGKKDCGTVYRLRIKTSKNFPKLHFSKRRGKQWKPSRVYSHRAINNIIETNDFVEMTCIKVDSPTELFLTNNFIVTHNTAVLTERVRRLVKDGEEPSRIVVITFTNAAANELKRRLGEDYKEGLRISTIHSYANFLLTKNGVDTARVLSNMDFDKLFNMVLTNPKCVDPVDHLLLDEAQDSTSNQFDFLLETVKPKNFFLIGDLRQSIFQFAGASPEYLEKLMTNGDTTVFDLNKNYRSREEIVEYCNNYLDMHGHFMGETFSEVGEGGSVVKLDRGPLTMLVDLIKHDVTCFKSDYRDWFILTRTNRMLEDVYNTLTRGGIPTSTFKKADLEEGMLNQELAKDSVKVLTIHSAKGLENKKVIVIKEFPVKGSEEICVEYVAASRAMDELYFFKPKKGNWRR